MSAEQQQGMDRRRFLTVLGVTGTGTAVLSGCSTDKVQKLVPYLVQSEDQVPGIPTIYASTCTECAAGCGVQVRTREGRAIKLEGNPEHPVNAGTLCARGQAALQGLYNPDRITGPMARNTSGGFDPITWDDALARLAERVGAAAGAVAVVNGAAPGTLSDLLATWSGSVGGRIVRYEPFDHEPMREANRQVFGRDELPAHDFARARMIVSFGADFLETWLSPTENQRGFAASHGFANGTMARHVYLSPRMSLTGMNADEWLALRPGSEAAVALAMVGVIAAERTGAPADVSAVRDLLGAWTPERAAEESGLTADAIRGLAREFASAAPGLAVAGGIGSQHRNATAVCAAVNLLNYVAGNIGETVHFGAALAQGDGYAALRSMIGAMASGAVQVLLVHEANPVHTLPGHAGFGEAMGRVPFKVSTSLFLDDTASQCDLLLPNHHALERWDDLTPRAGIRALMQPVMTPVFNTRSTGDLILQVAARTGAAAGLTAPDYLTHLKARWADLARTSGSGDPDMFWREALRRGGLFQATTPAAVRLAPTAGEVSAERPAFDGHGAYTLMAYPSMMYYDGRGANRPWLLENPDPVTKITWQTWVEVHPDTARELDVREGEILRLRSPHGTIEVPVYVYAGVRRDVLAVPIGLGHRDYGRWAGGRGARVLDLLDGPEGPFLPYLATTVDAERTGQYTKLAKTEGTPRQLGRGIAMAMPLPAARQGLTLDEAAHEAGADAHEINTERELEAIAGFREAQEEKIRHGAYALDHPKWGMVIDLSRCTGCSACVTACYAENNIPFVGESEVLRGREMSWMRIERYFEGGLGDDPLEARFVPMLCQHCDNAPCEPVCPVYASYHTPDGLNGQVYNRCVGTRYCGNNCPYKVRYFNWSAYSKQAFPEPLNLQLNPDVTVRARGVMEKCTFCVQRIRGAQNTARLEDRTLRDGDVVTACAQACPSGAITFGNALDPASAVAARQRDHRGYHVLEEINVRPAVTYLAKVHHRGEG